MVSSPADLERSYQNLTARSASLQQREGYLREQSSSIIRGISGWFSGSEKFHDSYAEAFREGRQYLAEAERQLADGNQAGAIAALRNADRYLDRAELFWEGHLRTTSGGAESTVTGQNTLSKGLIVMGGVGLGAIVLGFGAVPVAAMAIGGELLGAFFGSGDGLGLVDRRPEKEVRKSDSILGPGATRVEPKKKEALKKGEKKPLQCDGFDGKGNGIKGGEQCLTPPEAKEPSFEEIERRTRPANPVSKKDLRPVSGLAQIVAKVIKALIEFGEKGISSIKVGRTLLDYDKATNGSGMSREYFSFLVGRLHEHLEQYRRELAGVSDWKEQVKLLREFLFRDYFFDYRSGQASLLGLLDGKGGNCEARTELFLYAIEELGIAIPPGWRAGVQQFKADERLIGHIQLVLVRFDEQTKSVKEVWNLQDNETLTTVKAPVYDPLYLLYGLLLAQNVTPPFPFERLRIASPPPELLVAEGSNQPLTTTEMKKNNSNLVLPGGGGVPYDGASPDRAFSTSGLSGSSQISLKDLGIPTIMAVFPDALNRQDGYYSMDVAADTQIFTTIFGNAPFVLKYRTGGGVLNFASLRSEIERITFPRVEDAETFISLSSSEEKVRFLTYLARQSIAEMIASAPVTCLEARSLLERPGKVIRRKDARSLRTAIQFLKEINGTVTTYSGHISAMARGLGVSNPSVELGSHVSSYQFLLRHQQRLRAAIWNRPENYIVLMDRLSPEKRQILMDLFKQINVDDPPGSDRFYRAIADRRLIGVGKREGFEPLAVKVNLVYLPNSSVDLPTLKAPKTDDRPEGPIDQKGQKGVGKEGGFSPEPEARHYITASTLVDLILRYGGSSREAAARWNPALTREYERMTREEKRDRDFLMVVPNLIRAYPRRARTRTIDTGETLNFKKIFLKAPPDLARVIEEIRRRNPDAFVDLIFSLAKSMEERAIFTIER